MKLFTKLALVAAIGTSGSAFAMQSMDDAALAETTGQDGITLTIAPPTGGLKIDQIAIFDRDGVASTPTTGNGNEAGAILLGKVGTVAAGTGTGVGFSIVGGAIKVDIDSTGGGAAAATTGTTPMVNIKVTLPTTFTINTGDISVAGAQGAAGAQTVNTNDNTKILDSLAISLNGATMNIQLGNTTQGSMINLGGSITGGLTIGTSGTGVGGIYLKDNTAGYLGNIGVQKLTLTSFGSADLALNVNVGVANVANFNTLMGTSGTTGGLVAQFGGTPKFNLYMEGVTLGASAPSAMVAGERIGDIRVTGLDLTGTKIGIQGH